MSNLVDKHIVLGIGAGISAYRTLDLIRLLKKSGASVRAAPTQSATQFVTPLSLETLCQAPCLAQPLRTKDSNISHIEEAYAADLIVVAPATADLIAKMAHGFADEILLQTVLSFKGPVLIAPAMETHMWEHPATQANLEILKSRGVIAIGPKAGALASGRDGLGRMAEPAEIFEAILTQLTPKDFQGTEVLITAGPTEEPIDPVRFIANRSSGKMGVALARALAHRGAIVHLVHGPLSIQMPSLPQIEIYPVKTAQEMADKVDALAQQVELAILCAAVSDFRPKWVAQEKIKRSSGRLKTLDLEENPDILASLGKRLKRPFLVGFAAETENVEENAIKKCNQKNADLICANDVSKLESTFGSDTNRITIVDKNGIVQSLPRLTKAKTADQILSVILARRRRL